MYYFLSKPALLVAVLVLLVAGCSLSDRLSPGADTPLDPALANTPDGEYVIKSVEFEKGVSTVYTPYADPTPDWTWDLISNQFQYFGSVTVRNSDTMLYIEYELAESPLDQAAVLVSATQPGPKDGNPGQFPYNVEFEVPVSAYTFEIPLSNFTGKDKLYIAAYGHTVSDHGLWAGYFNEGGTPYWDFNWQKWGGGFVTRVAPLPDLPNGAGDTVAYMGYHWGWWSYWDVLFTTPVSLPPGAYGQSPSRPIGNYYMGWCVDQGHVIRSGYPYSVLVYSSYDPNKPDWADSDNWDMVNYLINRRRSGAYSSFGPFSGYSVAATLNKNAFQNAVWYFIGVVATPPPGSGIAGVPDYDPNGTDLYNTLITDALANGDNYIPGRNQYYALILFDRDRALTNGEQRFQMNVIEVDP